MNGILLIDKPQGWTSFDVVNYVRRMIATSEDKKPKHIKVGHSGTLDPLATGLLVLLVGSYTKQAGAFSGLDKTYEGTMKLGETSTTGDEEGEKTTVSTTQPTPSELQTAAKQFLGTILQTPPGYSAIKVNGQRAYTLARAGKTVQLEPRSVQIHSLALSNYSYPTAHFVTVVSSGTYIRSLVEDIGKELETGAYMTSLRRTTVGSFRIEDALDISSLTAERIEQALLQREV
jgi:tRNA pseudouridine55 synthase